MPNHREILHSLTEEILCSENPGDLRSACHRLYGLFSGPTGVSDAENPDDTVETALPGGMALSPRDAARCVWDFSRTTAFLHGVNDAVRVLQRQFPGERLEILYAGCGPFAPLVIPLLSRFASADLRVTLLDYHPRSLESAERLALQFELQDHIAGYVLADATQYQHGRPLHLIICEMMQSALRNEPQVPATRNLVPQLAAKGIFLPQRIWVEACWADQARERGLDGRPRDRTFCYQVLELDADALRQNSTLPLPPVTVTIPTTANANSSLLLLTKVQVFNSIVLGDYDSGITYPTVVSTLNDLKPGDRVEFSYVANDRPRFEYRVLPAAKP